uniref:Poly [ADP-ribose] polymerase n=1 Tax=Oryzias melastigma TaxID=30732 RepID=A0A3B3BZ84_ORYME
MVKIMAMFENCVVVLELKNLPYKEREFCKSLFLENGAKISLVVNKQCSMVVASDVNNLSSSRLRSIQKYKIPVVDLNYVYGCTRTGVRQPVELFMLEIPPSGFSPARLRPPTQRADVCLNFYRIYAEMDFSLPRFPDHFEVAKYTIFERVSVCSFGCFLLNLRLIPDQQLLLEEKLNTASVSQEVGAFVELLWTEALGCLANVLLVPINKLSLNDVTRAEGLLLQAQKKRKDADPLEAAALLKEVYDLLPHREPRPPEPSASFLSQKLDLCQLIRDVLNVSEMTLWSSTPSSVGKYRALRCSVEVVPPSSSEFQDVARLLQHSSLQIHQIVRVSRRAELQTFNSELSNTRALLHSSNPTNFVGILSRGLLLPRVGVELHGIQRTDVGNLGSGIYFSDSLSTSLKYSKPSETDGSRMLLVCDVALGNCKDFLQKDPTLTHAPLGYHSVHGVRHTAGSHSDFEDDEYVVYSPDQVKLKYVVRFSVDGEQLKEFRPPDEEQTEEVKNPRDDLKPGLQESSGLMLPLESIHVRCKLVDLLSQVIVFQKYTNLSPVPIEAKYVFPLDNSATVCGFEAFINGKHVVGQVKEKETARKEYKQAVEKGHGAYLMDQDAPDVFTISVGNLPPGASVLIKITYVSELVVSGGRINFSLPGSLAPWQVSDGLKQITQVRGGAGILKSKLSFSLEMSVEMPNEILYLKSYTHQIKTKRTDCKAVISVVPGQPLYPEGFELSIGFSNIHLPRMWVENHPDKDSQACMLVFYPDFEAKSDSAAEEVILLLDTSESMRGESLRSAQRIALKLLHHLSHSFRLNVILFGSGWFLGGIYSAHLCSDCSSICSLVGGSTELWRPLRALSLLPPSCGVRNLLLLSDGHIQNPELTLQLIRDGAPQSRLFTCGFSSTANRHMLRALAQVGGGAYEFFDAKAKHNWEEKMLRQVGRIRSPGCSSVSVKWQQFSSMAPPPVQAPMQLNALFNDYHTLVYGFVPHCTQATLFGNLCGQELRTLVSTSELQKTRGTFLHKLTARAIIRDYEDGNLDSSEAEHEGKKEELKSFIIELSKEYSILSQFTSFVAIEERQPESGFTDIPKLIAEEDVDFLPYVDWTFYPPKNQVRQVATSSCSLLISSLFMYFPPQSRVELSAPQLEGTIELFPSSSKSLRIGAPPPLPQSLPAGGSAYPPVATEAIMFEESPDECLISSVITPCAMEEESEFVQPLASRDISEVSLSFFFSLFVIFAFLLFVSTLINTFFFYFDSSISYISNTVLIFLRTVFVLQEGFWELTNELGLLLNFNVDVFANVFLMSKGIKSLGPKAHEDILRMCATLLVLQLMRVEKMEEGKLLRSLFHLEETPSRLDRWTAVKKAVDWVRWAERQYPCIYSRLEFGLNWESSTRQLLGVEGLPPFSPLIGLNLRQGPTPMLVQ